MTETLTVTLRREFPAECASKLWGWLNSPREPNFDDFSTDDEQIFLMDLAERVEEERTWAVKANSRIVGYLAFRPSNPVFGQFHGLVIDPAYRRHGIGTAAFRAAIAELVAQGFKSFMVMPFADNAPITHILQKVGFRETGRILHASERDGDPVNLRIMTRGVD